MIMMMMIKVSLVFTSPFSLPDDDDDDDEDDDDDGSGCDGEVSIFMIGL